MDDDDLLAGSSMSAVQCRFLGIVIAPPVLIVSYLPNRRFWHEWNKKLKQLSNVIYQNLM